MKNKKKVAVFIILFIGLLLISFTCYKLLGSSGSNNEELEEDGAIYSAASHGKNTIYVVDDGETYEVAYHNVKTFGAVDISTKKNNKNFNENLYDSSEAFNNAIKAAAGCSGTGGCGNLVYIPEGEYVLNNLVNIRAYVGLIGAGPDKTILRINHGETSVKDSNEAVQMQQQTSIKGVSFYYPKQKINSDGSVKAYQPTIRGKGFAQIENIRFINSYIALDLTGEKTDAYNNSIYFINNITGTPLKKGIVNDGNLDTIRLSNITFNSSYWNKYDKTNISSIKKALMNEKSTPTAIEFRRVDWSFFAKLNIEDYYRGIYLTNSSLIRNKQPDYKQGEIGRKPRDTEGELFDSVIKNCKYPMDIYNSRHYVITSSTLESSGGIGLNIHDNKINSAAEIDFHDITTDYSIYDSTISSTGSAAIYYGGFGVAKTKDNKGEYGYGSISITNSTISGKINKVHSETNMSIVGSKLTNTGMDGCSVAATLTYTKPTGYADKVVTKPKSTYIVTVDGKKTKKEKGKTVKVSFTEELKNAINTIKNHTEYKNGGIIYIPTGKYTLTETITVPSGIEIVGSTPWMHNGSLWYSDGVGSTRITLAGSAKAPTKIILSGGSGLNGLEILVKDSSSYAIEGKGDNIYVRNVSLPGVKNGINISGNKFLIEHIWGAIENKGIKVNGDNGIIRECHFTKNARLDTKNTREDLYIKNETFTISGKNNIVYHDFTFGPMTGFIFDNATNAKAIGIGSDSTSLDVKMNNSSGMIINAMLVSNHKNSSNNYYILGSSLKDKVEVINPILWSADSGTGVVLKGNADIHLYGGIYERFEFPAVTSSNPLMIIAGAIFRQGLNKPDIKLVTLESGAKTVNIIGNICKEGNCIDYIDNQIKANVGKSNPITSCKAQQTPQQPQQPQQQTPQQKTPAVNGAYIDKSPSYAWANLTLSNTTINGKSATTTVCNLGKSYTNFVYSTSKDKEKTVKISNGCATISMTSGTGQYLKYKLTSSKAMTETRTVTNVGKYLIYAQVYNKFLYVGNAASNNALNLGGWVSKNGNVSTYVSSIGTVAVNNSVRKNNTDFVRMVYRGILGREADAGGLKTWENFLKKNSRYEVLKRFIQSQEAKNIYSAWGYR